MVKSFDRILREVADACEYVRAGGVVHDAVAGGTKSGLALAGLKDGDLLKDYMPVLADLDPATVAVGTAGEVEMVFGALTRIHGFSGPGSEVDYAIAHEGAHLSVARSLFAETQYWLTILASEPGRTYGVRPYSAFARQRGKLTKLDVALVTAAAPDPSPGDSARLTAMGYQGRNDVLRRAAAARSPLAPGILAGDFSCVPARAPGGRAPRPAARFPPAAGTADRPGR